MRTLLLTLTTCLLVLPAQAKYSGGSGTAQDPYQITTAADLIALGNEPNDYDKQFILKANIDFDPNLPFDKAVIASNNSFTGIFDGKGHTISRLTIKGKDNLGLFGQLASGSEVRNVGVVDVAIIGSGSGVGGLAGWNSGTVTRCYSSGAVSGIGSVGGLVGYNGDSRPTVAECYSTVVVSGNHRIGGLVGINSGIVSHCYSTGSVSGDNLVGGVAGYNSDSMTECYSTGVVKGLSYVGGLVGNSGGTVIGCCWDMGASGLSGSAGGVGLATAEMLDPYMLGLNGFGNDPNWILDASHDYPRLAWQGTPGHVIPEPNIDWLAGRGTAEAPYRIDTAEHLVLLGKASILWDRHFVLGADMDLDPNLVGGQVFGQAVIPVFMGIFDGNGHTISHLTILGGSNLGLFGQLAFSAEVKKLGVVEVNIVGSGIRIGGLVGKSFGSVIQCGITGTVTGGHSVGGLVGENWSGVLKQCYSTAAVSGEGTVGGLAGANSDSYSLIECYSTGSVSSEGDVGGLVGADYNMWEQWGRVSQCFWDTEASGQSTSACGIGKTTAEMQMAGTFLHAGWDFVGEAANGREDIWGIVEGTGYPRLWWELPPKYSGGRGRPDDPYRIATVADLILLGDGPGDYYCHFILTADIDLDPNLPGRKVFDQAVIAPAYFLPRGGISGTPFTGVFDGNGHTISHLTIDGGSHLGLFGWLDVGAEIENLRVVDVNITGSGDCVGGLVGWNQGSVAECYSTGGVSGYSEVGGLVGENGGTVTECYSTGVVTGVDVFAWSSEVGGLVGYNGRIVTNCYSTCEVTGNDDIGGLVGYNVGTLTKCYSTGLVSGTAGKGTTHVGGLVGFTGGGRTWSGTVTGCFWLVQPRGPTGSAGGTKLTQANMQKAKTFLDAGWDFVNIWWINEGKDYPRLWWEKGDEASP